MHEPLKAAEIHPDAIKREEDIRKLGDEIAELNAQIQAARSYLKRLRRLSKKPTLSKHSGSVVSRTDWK